MSNEELVAVIQSGEEERMGELWEQAKGLVAWKARHIMTALDLRGSSCGVEIEDLVQSGYLALVKAVETYKQENGAFSTWLTCHLKNTFADVTGYRTQRDKNDPLNNALSLEKTIADGEDFTLADTIEDPHAADAMQSIEDRIWFDQLREVIGEMLLDLPEKQADILYRRFWQDQTYAAIGADIGIAAENVRVNEWRGLRNLRRSNNMNRLTSFHEFDCYSGTGLGAFQKTGVSVQERYLMIEDERKNMGA